MVPLDSTCADTCADTCTDTCTYTCADICADTCAYTCADTTRVHTRVQTRVHTAPTEAIISAAGRGVLVAEMDSRRGIAAQVEFEEHTLKPVFFTS
jgi:hypothetical protein